jgi:mercuric ion transport protein
MQGEKAQGGMVCQLCHCRVYCCSDRPALAGVGGSGDVVTLGGAAMKDPLLKVGLIGTTVSALCCFTPVLVWLLAGLGLAGVVGALDLVLLPALALFFCITGYALWRRRHPR